MAQCTDISGGNMKNPNDVAEAYLAVWNEADTDKRQTLIEQLWTPDATYFDPMMQGRGHNGLNAMIGQAQLQFPGLRFQRARDGQAVENHVRFSWHLTPAGVEHGSAPLAGGTDFCTLANDGRLQSVCGFVDFLNAPQTEED
jgi:hypothetical protein